MDDKKNAPVEPMKPVPRVRVLAARAVGSQAVGALLSELPNMMREIHSDPHDQPLYSTQNVKEPAANKPADGVLNIVPYQPDGAGQSREEPCREELGPNEPGQREPAADASDGSEEQAGPRGGAPEPAA